MRSPFSPEALFDLGRTRHGELFEGVDHAWEVLPRIAAYLSARMRPGFFGERLGAPFLGESVHVGAGTLIEPGAVVKGPAWIGENCQVRAGCYIRENVILGDGVVAGNSSEFKNCVLFDGCEVPHFNYVGDSILGYRAHLGAGVVLSNVKLTRDNIAVRDAGQVWETGLRKFGALIGDRTEVGCHCVINPGSVLGRDCILYPGVIWRGVLPARHIAKQTATLQTVARGEVR